MSWQETVSSAMFAAAAAFAIMMSSKESYDIQTDSSSCPCSKSLRLPTFAPTSRSDRRAAISAPTQTLSLSVVRAYGIRLGLRASCGIGPRSGGGRVSPIRHWKTGSAARCSTAQRHVRGSSTNADLVFLCSLPRDERYSAQEERAACDDDDDDRRRGQPAASSTSPQTRQWQPGGPGLEHIVVFNTILIVVRYGSDDDANRAHHPT